MRMFPNLRVIFVFKTNATRVHYPLTNLLTDFSLCNNDYVTEFIVPYSNTLRLRLELLEIRNNKALRSVETVTNFKLIDELRVLGNANLEMFGNRVFFEDIGCVNVVVGEHVIIKTD